ncbi:unnamed protein product [Cylicocyclus nassatus]|uniref:Uncharacterized protein n=1 Tax=Cylicocyclus nassatus TaxID=53992 RepID=A0AA36GPV7_CYLNA|nr:unnamed protein product [Cylicocyclus nassatus]
MDKLSQSYVLVNTRQRSSQPLTETESSPWKRPRVSSPVGDVPGESLIESSILDLEVENVSLEEGDIGSLVLQASSFSSLKQFDRPQRTTMRDCCRNDSMFKDFPWLEVREMLTIYGRGVYAKVDIAKEMAVVDYRGYQGLVEDVKNSLKKFNEEERRKVIKYWHGFRRRGCDFIVPAHCDSYKATVTLGRLIASR